MNFFDKMVEHFIRLNKKMKRWQRVVSVLSAVVVFVTTYALILPAITLDKDTAQQQPGIELAASEANVEESGEAVVEAEPEEEPALEETAEPEAVVEEEQKNDNEDEEPEHIEETVSEETVVEEPEDNTDDESEYIEDEEPEDSDEDVTQSGEYNVHSNDDADEDSIGASDVDENGTRETLEDDVLATEDLAAVIAAGEIELITEKTQLVYEYIDEEYEKNKDKEDNEDEDDGYFVYAEFGASAKLPVGVEMQVTEITKESDPELYTMYCEKTLKEVQDKYDENTGITFAKFYDISFVYDGKVVEPSGDVKIRIEYKKEIEIKKDVKVDALHFDKENDEKPEVIESEVNPDDKEKDKKNKEIEDKENEQMKAVEFTSDQFSVYGVIGTGSITTTFLSADGNTYEVTVTCDTDANIPAGSELVVSEVEAESEKYEGYLTSAAEAMDISADKIAYAKLLDISIVYEGEDITPETPVDVRIRLLDRDDITENTSLNVLHYESETENPVPVDGTDQDGVVSFTAEGFSVYGVFYTVDFAWEVDGKTYEFNLNGGGYISFTALAEALGLSQSAADFVDGVENIEFSSPELVWVGKIEEESSVAQIKEANGIESQYSEELSEEDIAEINAQTVQAGDWALISVLPFETEEILTVTMQDGEVFTIKVTDAQLKKTVISESGETWEITVEYNADAEIPEGSELKVKEILPTNKKYSRYYNESVRTANGENADTAVADTTEEIVSDAEETTENQAMDSVPVPTGEENELNNTKDLVYDTEAEAANETAVAETAEDTEEGETESDTFNNYVRIFDIEIWNGEEKIEPKAAVQVSIKLMDAPEGSKYMPSVVHFAKSGAELIELSGSNAKSANDSISFKTSEFSVYSVVYTVDFHWEVNGKEYELSLPGGGFVSFEALMELMGVAQNETRSEADSASEEAADEDTNVVNAEDKLTVNDVPISEETKEFVENVENVVFSNPELVWVRKVNEDTTVGELKEANELEIQYSANLTNEEIEWINAQTVEAGDWALISMLPFVTEESLTVTMKNGEVFTVKVTDTQDPLGLDDRTVAFVLRDNPNNRYVSVQSALYNNNNELAGRVVNYLLNGGVEYCNENASVWLFEYDPVVQGYYITNGYHSDSTVRYLKMHTGAENNNVTLESSKENATPIKIDYDDTNGTYSLYVQDGETKYYLTYRSNNPSFYSHRASSANANSSFHFCLPEEDNSGTISSHKATLVSAQDIQPGQSIVIYKRALYFNPNNPDDPLNDTYVYYAIDGGANGSNRDSQLVRVYNSSDSIYWKGDPTIEWELVDTGNGYYTFQNKATGKYLAPKGNDTILQNLSDYPAGTPEDPMDNMDISLPGKKAGDYSSQIANWDYQRGVTSGLGVTLTYGSQASANIEAVDFLGSDEFYFAVRDPIVQGELTEVDTVDSKADGITIKMYDFSGAIKPYSNNQRLQFMSDVLYDAWGEGVLPQGLVQRVLGSDGFPVTTGINNQTSGKSLAQIFEASGNVNRGPVDANHLFIQSVYDATGYYHYSAFENFARLPDDSSDFTVYEQIGSPASSGENDWNSPYMNRGNFMPFNELDMNSPKTNMYQSQNSDQLPDDDPRKGEDLYLLKNRPGSRDYFFGMTMEAKFIQGADGLNDRNDPMRFEFNGDDDMWVFVDNVLLLDIGGVHDAFQGYIDFRTGVIEIYPATHQSQNMFKGQKTTIKEQYRLAGKFPDGTNWTSSTDQATINKYFSDNTFKDFSVHDFKMFYMERGAGASSLEMQFNLKTLTADAFRVTKDVPDTESGQLVQENYGHEVFYYQAHKVVDNVDTLCTKTEYEQTATYSDGGHVIWTTENIFEMKPGQTANFPVFDGGVRYYVEELDLDSDKNIVTQGSENGKLKNFDVTNSDPLSGQDAKKQYKTKTEKVRNRGEVIFYNHPDDDIVNELQIVKELEGDLIVGPDGKLISSTQTGSPYFEYKVYLENTDGVMTPYSLGAYYQLDKNGYFVYYTKADNRRHVAKFEKTESGGKPHYKYTFYSDDTETTLGTTPGSYTLNGQVVTNSSGVYETDTPLYSEHASENGSIADIRPGDTIYIIGLLEGTDFAVDERVDRSHMTLDPTETEKYYYVGTDVRDAYTRPNSDPSITEDMPGGIFDVPDYSGISYDTERAALGAIVNGKDAKVKVKNRGDLSYEIRLKKNWLIQNGFSFSMLDQEDSKVKFTVKRYKLTDKFGTFTLTGALTGDVPTNANPVYIIKQGDTAVKTIPFSSMSPVQGNENTRSISVDLPVGTYTVVCAADVDGYDETTTPSSPAVTVTANTEEGQPETTTTPDAITLTSNYTQQFGTLRIKKTLKGDYSGDTQFSATYAITRAGETTPVQTVTVNFNQMTVDGNTKTWTSEPISLPVWNYIITETINTTNSPKAVHSPSSHTIYLPKGYEAMAAFTANYPPAQKLVPVTLHFGHSGNGGSGWVQDSTKVLNNQYPAGGKFRVEVTFKNCRWYYPSPGAYAYDTTSSFSNPTNVQAYDANDYGTTTQWFEFTIPESADSYDVYFKSRCDNSQWAPSYSNEAEGTRSSGTKFMSRGTRGPLRAGESSEIKLVNISPVYNDEVNPDTLPELTSPDDVNKKYVIDDTWEMVVEMGRAGYTQTVTWAGTPSPDTKTGEMSQDAWEALFTHRSIVSKDENGYPYYYYIEAVEEIQVPKGTSPEIDLAHEADPNDPEDHDKTLMTMYLDPHTLSVTNGYVPVGALKISKEVRVNGTLVTAGTPASIRALANGSYTFEIWNADGTAKVTKKADGTDIGTLTITVTDGVVSPNPLVVQGLLVGNYVLKETGSTNEGMIIDTTNTDGYDAELGGIPVTVNDDEVVDVQSKTFVNDYETTEVTIEKTWADSNKVNHETDVVHYQLSRIPHSGETDYPSEPVAAADGYSGILKGSTNPAFKETVTNLPVNGIYTPNPSNPDNKIPVTYTYDVSEVTFEGYQSLVSYEVDGDGHYSFSIYNEPHGDFYEDTEVALEKEWEGEHADEHDSDNITVRLTQKKYPARVRWVRPVNSEEVISTVYPVKIMLKNGDGTSSEHTTIVSPLSTMVFVPEGGTLKFNVSVGVNGSGSSDHSIICAGFTGDDDNGTHYNRRNYTYTLHVTGPTQVSLIARYNDSWGEEPGNNIWAYNITTDDSQVFYDQEELIRYIDKTGGSTDATYDYTMSINSTVDPKATVLSPIGTTVGTPAGTGLWKGEITSLPFLEQDETNENVFYVYDYEISEAKVGTETVGVTPIEESETPLPDGYTGQTSLYYVKWVKDAEGNWVITNKEKPTVDVDVTKTWANPDELPENTSITVVLGTTAENVNLTALGVVTTQVISSASTDENHPDGWYYKWTDLPKTDNSGTTIAYSVTETQIIIDGQSYPVADAQIEADEENSDYSFFLKNKIPSTEVKAKKEWSQEKLPADTSVELTIKATLPDSEENIIGQLGLDEDSLVKTLSGTDASSEHESDWIATWSDLPRYHDHQKINYTVEETKIVVEGTTIWSAEDGTPNPLLTSTDVTNPTYAAVLTNKLPSKTVVAHKQWLDAEGNVMTPTHGETVTFGLYIKPAESTEPEEPGEPANPDDEDEQDEPEEPEEQTDPAEPEPIATVVLNGTQVTVVPADGSTPVGYEGEAWVAYFKNLQKYDENGEEIYYWIKEIVECTDYTNLDPEGVDEGGTIGNRRTEVDVSVPAVKTMVDGEIPATGTFHFTLEANPTTSGGESGEGGEYGPLPSRATTTEMAAHKMTITNEGTEINFGPIIFKLTDFEKGELVEGHENQRRFTYTVKELNTEVFGVLYDDAEFLVTVTLTYDRESGILTADRVITKVTAPEEPDTTDGDGDANTPDGDGDANTPDGTETPDGDGDANTPDGDGDANAPASVEQISFTNEERVTIHASKVWTNGSENINSTIKNATVTFQLQQCTDDPVTETSVWVPVTTDAVGDPVTNPVTMEVGTAADEDVWDTAEWSNLKKFVVEGGTSRRVSYRVVETYAAFGKEEQQAVLVEGEDDEGKPSQIVIFSKNLNTGTATIENALPTVDIEVNKDWKTDAAPDTWPEDITRVVVELKQSVNGSQAAFLDPARTAEISAANWKLTAEEIEEIEDEEEKAIAGYNLAKRFFNDLPQYDNEGNLITYSVVETEIEILTDTDENPDTDPEPVLTPADETEFAIVYSPQTTSTGGLITVTNALDRDCFFIKKWIGMDQDKTNPVTWPQVDKGDDSQEDVPITITMTRRLRYADTEGGTPTDHVVANDTFIPFIFEINSAGIIENSVDSPYNVSVTCSNNVYTVTVSGVDIVGKDGEHSGEWIYYFHEATIDGYQSPGYLMSTETDLSKIIQSKDYSTDEGGQIFNTPGVQLPYTGGSGTLPYTLGGIMLIMLSALMYGLRMRRRERRLN